MSIRENLQWAFGLTLVISSLTGCGGAQAEPTATSAQPTATPALTSEPPAATPIPTPTDTPPESALLRLLRFVPDTPEYRQWVTYGDADAWHTSWNIPRVGSREELESLMTREQAALWKFNLLDQTFPPDSLGHDYLWLEDQLGFYGFDLFNVDRFLGAGPPRDSITVVEFGFDDVQIADALTASDYEAEVLETGGMLYSILDDYEMDLEFPMSVGKLGQRNRIALLDGQMVIARATVNATNALAAHSDQSPSLADDPVYLAVAEVLENPALKDTGELIGVILMEGSQFADPAWYLGENASEEDLQKLKEYLRQAKGFQGPQLPTHSLVAFVTRHTTGASYLILVVVFPKGTDAALGAEVLADRLENYVSFVAERPLNDFWTLEKVTSLEAQGSPVALVVLRVDDPPPLSKDADQAQVAVFTWGRMVDRYRDVLFLMTELPVE